MTSNVSVSLGQFDDGDSGEWLSRFQYYCKAAQKVMHYKDKSGKTHSLPPVESTMDAEDLASRMLEELYKCTQRFGETVPIRYAMRIWRNLRVDWYRQHRRHYGANQAHTYDADPGYASEQPGKPSQSFWASLDAYQSSQKRLDLQMAFESIRARSTGSIRKGLDAIVHRYRFGMTYAELAKAWGIPEGTLKTYVFEAHKYLREVL